MTIVSPTKAKLQVDLLEEERVSSGEKVQPPSLLKVED